MKKLLFSDGSLSLASLTLRLSLGLMMAIGHGYSKLNMLMTGKAEFFPDPLGIGNFASLLGAVTTEFFFSIALIIGLMTRVSAVGLAFTMAVAAFVQHGADPFFPTFVRGLSEQYPALMTPNKEFAVLFLVSYVAIFLMGPGKFSVDAWIRGAK